MSDLTAAVEAAAEAVARNRWGYNAAPWIAHLAHSANASCAVCTGDIHQMMRVAIAAAAPLIEAAARADERAKTAEDIAEAITLNVRNPDFTKQDRGGFVGFTECMAYVAGHDNAAAIARQHANGMPDHPSHASNPHVARKQPGNRPESHQGATTDQQRGTGTTANPNPAQGN